MHRLKVAILTTLNFQEWAILGVLLLLYTLISLPIGFHFSFLKLELVKISWGMIVSVIATCFVIPAIAEEVCFRILLLPHPSENVSLIKQWLWAGLSLVAFIIYHPLEGLTVFPEGRETFMNPVFLSLTGLLGIVCTIAYFQSGSLWPSVFIHWVIVVVWLLLLGGYGKLNT